MVKNILKIKIYLQLFHPLFNNLDQLLIIFILRSTEDKAYWRKILKVSNSQINFVKVYATLSIRECTIWNLYLVKHLNQLNLRHKTNIPSKHKHDQPDEQIEDTGDCSENFVDLDHFSFAFYLILRQLYENLGNPILLRILPLIFVELHLESRTFQMIEKFFLYVPPRKPLVFPLEQIVPISLGCKSVLIGRQIQR